MLKAYLVPHPPLIVPGIGKGDEIPDTRRAFERIAAETEHYAPDTVIVFSPHSIMYSDYIHISPGKGAEGNFGNFRAKNIRFSVDYDEALAALIGELADDAGIPAGSLGERDAKLDHGVMVPLYFLKSKQIIRISLSGLSLIDHYRFGMCVTEAVKRLSRKVVLIASGDMSHKLKADGPYGFAPEGPEHDTYVKDCLEAGDFRKLLAIEPSLRERAAECGLGSIVMVAGAMDGMKVETEVISYEGPFGVGYMTAAFTADGNAPSLLPSICADRDAKHANVRRNEDAYARLAAENAEHYIRTGKRIALPENLPAEMYARQAGVFVSIKKDGNLRGCIGTIMPTKKNIAAEIIENSVSAATKDPRFAPISPSELDALTYSVDVLSAPEPVSGQHELDPSRYGVIVSCGHKRGLLLPNLDGIDTAGEQIDIARKKGGIRENEPYTLERFEVVRHI